MSKTGDWVLELEEQADDRHLAKILNITYEELMELKYTIDKEESEDGLVYNYIIDFTNSKENPILKKISGLQKDNVVYLQPWQMEAEYDYLRDEFDAITYSSIDKMLFEVELDNLKKLSLLQKNGDSLKIILNRQVYIGIIGSLEKILADIFINLLFDNKAYFQNFIESHPDFKKQKFELREIFTKHSQLEAIAKKIVLNTIYHNLPIVRNMFKDAFEIEFPSISELQKHIFIRHDLVHRNGRTKAGALITIEDSDIDTLIKEVETFVEHICKELNIQ